MLSLHAIPFCFRYGKKYLTDLNALFGPNQINAGTELAMRYNDQSPLENHHCATAFDILSHSEANPFEHLDANTRRRIRDGIIR